MQGALFGRGSPEFDPARLAPGATHTQRTELAAGAWIEHHPGWLDGHSRVFEELARSVPWQSLRRQMYEREVDVPRLVARAPEAGPMASLLRRLAAALSERYGRALESISLNFYRDGRDSVAFHGDKLGSLVDDSIVATVSVGAPRRFLLAPNPRTAHPSSTPTDSTHTSSGSLAYDLGWGDLFVMGGTCQRTWQHAVPKRAHADPRISILFRPRVPQAAAG
jgi:alkylated DNA repair dioxygenase AlkB